MAFISPITNDPIALEEHINRQIASIRRGAIMDAIFSDLLTMAVAVSGLSMGKALALFALFFIMMLLPCQICSKFLKGGLHLPKFTFWGNPAFVIAGYLIQLALPIVIYAGIPLAIFAVMLSILESLPASLEGLAVLLYLAWPVLVFSYVAFQKHRLKSILTEQSVLSADED